MLLKLRSHNRGEGAIATHTLSMGAYVLGRNHAMTGVKSGRLFIFANDYKLGVKSGMSNINLVNQLRNCDLFSESGPNMSRHAI